LGGRTWLNFQVGTTNIEPQIAGGCLDCHGVSVPRQPASWVHTGSRAVPMVTDVCKVCHDNLHQMSGKTNWANSQYGFGVAPVSRRVHGIHYGNYLEKPDRNTSGIANMIFPQDVRNCTKCHTESPSWNTKPSRLACLACHDSDLAKVHGDLMTFDPTPADPWNGDEQETCILCHGQDSDFSASKVHTISNPYVPPYPRAPRGE
jgi:OmcA/MtrC family decaheme c-type cytochrome